MTFSTIKNKIGNILKYWNENSLDLSVCKMISPWKGVFDNKIMNSLLVNSVIPILIKIIKLIEYNIENYNNNNNNIEKINYILNEWSVILYPNQFISILEGECFSRIKYEIYKYLFHSTNFNYEIILKYYCYWRNIFNDYVHSNDEIRSEFIIILNMIECKLNNKKQCDYYNYENDYLNIKTIDYYSVYEKKRNKNSNNDKRKSIFNNSVQDYTSIPFEEIISQFASKNGITFLNLPQTYNGKKLYIFGSLKFYIEGDICYVFISESNSYDALSLEDMIRENNK